MQEGGERTLNPGQHWPDPGHGHLLSPAEPGTGGSLRRQPPHVAYETRDYQVTLALIEAGLGISLVPASMLGRTSRPGIAFRPVEGMPLARAIYLVHRKRTTALVTDIKTMITDLNPNTAAG